MKLWHNCVNTYQYFGARSARAVWATIESRPWLKNHHCVDGNDIGLNCVEKSIILILADTMWTLSCNVRDNLFTYCVWLYLISNTESASASNWLQFRRFLLLYRNDLGNEHAYIEKVRQGSYVIRIVLQSVLYQSDTLSAEFRIQSSYTFHLWDACRMWLCFQGPSRPSRMYRKTIFSWLQDIESAILLTIVWSDVPR